MTPPTLAPGDRFGAYEVVELVGAGGMGEVYRARDTRLSRDVALKVLPDHRRLDPQRQARFEREAQLLSSLNHPNIATLLGIEESAGSTALVMELVEGETIADMLSSGVSRSVSAAGDRRRRPLQVRRALEIARQIADALDSAHERGIIHRDLKLANIKVRPDGTVKVLDFGLARFTDDEVPGDTTAATLTASGSVGVVVGTAAYMSPEQARGMHVDRRADIWAFGCVLYEMLTGRRAFDGDTTSDALANILTKEPDLTALPADAPPSIRSLLRRCLAKEPKERLRDIGDARLELADALARSDEGIERVVAKRTARMPPWMAAAVGAAAVAAAVLGWLALRPQPLSSGPALAVKLLLPEAPFNPQPGMIHVSADGSRFSYPSVLGMAVAQTTNPVIDVMETVGGSGGVLLSPDGQWAAYFKGNAEKTELKTVPVAGGSEVLLASGVGRFATASWSAEGAIVFADHRGLFQVPAQGGVAPKSIPLSGLQPGEQALYPVLMPDGRHVLYTVARTSGTNFASAAAAAPDARVEIVDAMTGARRTLVHGAAFAAYVPTGHLVYWSRRAIYARTFDAGTAELLGDAVRVLSDVAQFAVSPQGTLLYVTALEGPARSELVWVNRETGEEEPVPLDPRFYVYPRVSPNGEAIALDITEGGERDIYVWDIKRRQLTDVSKDATPNQLVAWTSFDRRPALVFGSRRTGLSGDTGAAEVSAVTNMFVRPADGTGEPARLLRSANNQMPISTAPDGRLIFAEFVPERGTDIKALDLKSRVVETILGSTATEANAEVSPDGAWIAYQSNETGRFEVWVQPYPRGTPTRISNQGGTQPLWTKDGTELLFRDFYGTVWATPVTRDFDRPARRILEPREYHGKGPILMARTYDVAGDGRLLMIKGQRQDLVLRTNWFEELRRLVPTP
jgi:serine/threonine-protein kinase